MAKLTPKGEKGDVAGQMAYRVSRLQARLKRLVLVMQRAEDNENSDQLAQFVEEKEMREAELNFLAKKFAMLMKDKVA